MNTVTGRFGTRDEAERAVSSLLEAGFDRAEISMTDLDDPPWRQAGEGGKIAVIEDRGSVRARALPLVGGLLGGAIGAFALPFALSVPLTRDPSQPAIIAMMVGAVIAFVFASRVASLLAHDELAGHRGLARIVAAPTIVWVRTLDGFSRRAARILQRSGGVSVASETF